MKHIYLNMKALRQQQYRRLAMLYILYDELFY